MMIVLWTLYVYHMARVGVGSLMVQLKAIITGILHKFIVVAIGDKTYYKQLNSKKYI